MAELKSQMVGLSLGITRSSCSRNCHGDIVSLCACAGLLCIGLVFRQVLLKSWQVGTSGSHAWLVGVEGGATAGESFGGSSKS